MTPAQVFDGLAEKYDAQWTQARAGRLQREAFWNCAGAYLRNAARVVDIGCGTGEDAIRLASAGLQVTAVDISPRMVALARSRGVNARVLSFEDLASLGERFDVAMSNFGPLNCVADLAAVREPLARTVEHGGYAILCILSRFCLWETVWHLLHGDARRAVRRWRGESPGPGGMRVFYPVVQDIRRCLTPEFTLVEQFGIGISVPPSYVRHVPEAALRLAARIDRILAPNRAFRILADHTLLILRRN